MNVAIADDNNMGGLYIGLGANVGYDEYDARVNVGYQPANAIKSVTVDKAINGVTLENCDSANNLVTKLWECGKTGEPQDITYKDETDDIDEVTIVSSKDMSEYEEVAVYSGSYTCEYGYSDQPVDIYADINSSTYIQVDDFSTIKHNLFADNSSLHIHENSNCQYKIDGSGVLQNITGDEKQKYYYRIHPDGGTNDEYDYDTYDEKLGWTYISAPRVQLAKLKEVSNSVITSDNATYLMSQSLNRSGHNAGGEMKMAYFHDFGNHVMAGLDLTGAVLSKNRRDIQVSKFNVNDNPNVILYSDGNKIATAEYKDDTYVVSTYNGIIEQEKPLTLSVDTDSLKDMQVTSDPITGTYLDVSSGDKDVSFEKGIFNPKLAFVVGGTYNGWFAGLRAGVSYNTGKIKTPDMRSSKSVSIASPLVGVQVMKKVSNNTNLYMTADWNVGDLRRSVDMNGIKSFKQSSYNISAGVQWKCSFLK